MDILKNYNEDQSQPTANRSAVGQTFSGSDSALIRLLMRVSGGKIQDEKTANYVLIGVVVVIGLISIMLFIKAVRLPSPPPASEIVPVPGLDQ